MLFGGSISDYRELYANFAIARAVITVAADVNLAYTNTWMMKAAVNLRVKD